MTKKVSVKFEGLHESINQAKEVNKELQQSVILNDKIIAQKKKEIALEREKVKEAANERAKKELGKKLGKKIIDRKNEHGKEIVEAITPLGGTGEIPTSIDFVKKRYNELKKPITDDIEKFVSSIDGSIHYTEAALDRFNAQMWELKRKDLELMKENERFLETVKMHTEMELDAITRDRRDALKINKENYPSEGFSIGLEKKNFLEELNKKEKTKKAEDIDQKINKDADQKIAKSLAKRDQKIADHIYGTVVLNDVVVEANNKKTKKTSIPKFRQLQASGDNMLNNAEDISENFGEGKTKMVKSKSLQYEEELKQPIAPHASFVPATAMTLGESLDTIEPIPMPAIAQNKEFIESFTGAKEAQESFADTYVETNDTIQKSDEETKKSSKEKFVELHEKMQENIGYMQEAMGSLSTIANTLWQDQIAEAQEKLAEVSEQFNEVVEQRRESDARLQELEEQAKNARGGRGAALQAQIDAEMAKNKQLADQEKNLAKEKEKQEKEIAKKEKQMKKMELTQNIVMTFAVFLLCCPQISRCPLPA